MAAGPSPLPLPTAAAAAGAAFLPPPAASPLHMGWPGRRLPSATLPGRPPPSPCRVVAVATPRVRGRRRAPTRHGAAAGGGSAGGVGGSGGGSVAASNTSRSLLGTPRRGGRRPSSAAVAAPARGVARKPLAKTIADAEATAGLERAIAADSEVGGSPRAAPDAVAAAPTPAVDSMRRRVAADSPPAAEAAVPVATADAAMSKKAVVSAVAATDAAAEGTSPGAQASPNRRPRASVAADEPEAILPSPVAASAVLSAPSHSVKAAAPPTAKADPASAPSFLVPKQANSSSWESRYLELVQHQRASNVQATAPPPPPPPDLARWVQTQAAAYRRGRLGAVRAAALEALGFPWSSAPPNWGRHIAELTAFKAAHGHLRIPQDTKLGVWLCAQRSAARRGRLGVHRLAALDQVDTNWAGEPAGWDARAARWEAYVALTGDVEVRQAGSQAAAAAALEEQIVINAAGTTGGDQPRRRRSSGAAVAAETAAARVRAKAEADAAAAAAGVPLATPLPFSVYDDPDPEAFDLPRLYNWVVSQRLNRRTGRLNAARVARLDASGFVWDVHETAWRVNLLRYIATRHAALRVRAKLTPGAPSASALPPPVPPIAGLELLTPSVLAVDATDATQVALARLSPVEWQELLGPVSLPPVPVAPSTSTVEPPLPTPLRVSPLSAEAEASLLPSILPAPLASVPLWVASQRRRLASGTMPRARLVTLLEVGFPFQPLDVVWEAHADALAAVVGPIRLGERDRVRAARVAAACASDARLFFWVRSQRAAAAGGALPTGRASRLRDLGALAPSVSQRRE